MVKDVKNLLIPSEKTIRVIFFLPFLSIQIAYVTTTSTEQ